MTSIFLSLAVFILSFVVVKLLPSGPPFVRNGVILYALSNIQLPFALVSVAGFIGFLWGIIGLFFT